MTTELKNNNLPTLGIIGTGSFGQFIAEKLTSYFSVHLVGRKSSQVEYIQAIKSDYVVLSVPFSAYGEVLPEIKKYIPSTSVLIDICSVKILPTAAIKAAMPTQPFLSTHPLFGPQSAASSVVGQTIILCPQPDNNVLEAKATKLFETAGLKVVEMSEEAHDRLMAKVHGLTFFIARALALYGVTSQEITTPSFLRLADLAALEKHHSAELFATIQLANPYAAEARNNFMAIASKLANSLTAEKI